MGDERVILAAAAWNRQDWAAAVRDMVAHVKQDRLTVAAGAFAFRWFLSLFPVVIALLGVASLVRIPHHVVTSLVKGVDAALPPGAAQVLERAVVQASHRRATLLATVVAGIVGLWSGISGMVMVEEGLDIAYELPRDRSFVRKRLVALPLLLAATVLGGGASALVVLGSQLGHLIEHDAPVAGAAFEAAWTVVRWVVALVLTTLLLSVVYHLAPNRRQATWHLGSPGSLLATAVWAVVSLGFSSYTTSLGSYASTYGAFAWVAILSFWLFLTGIAIFLGGELDAAFERHLTAKAAGRIPGADPVLDEAGVGAPPGRGDSPGNEVSFR